MDESNDINSSSPEESNNDAPKINNYMDQNSQPHETENIHSQSEEPVEVDPTADREMPESEQSEEGPAKMPAQEMGEQSTTPEYVQEPVKTQKQTIGQIKNGAAPVAAKPPKVKKPIGKLGKVLLIISGVFFVVSIVMIFVAMSMVNKGAAATSLTPLAESIWGSRTHFVGWWIMFIHIIFMIYGLVLFVLTMLGLIKFLKAKKDKSPTSKKDFFRFIISVSLFFITFIVWLVLFVNLEGKRVPPEDIRPAIVTVPEETLGLSAPIEIRFDSSDAPIDRKNYRIITTEWDFGDGQVGTGQIVTHLYEKKGRYDVKLKITLRNIETGEETIDEHSKTISIENQSLSASFTLDPKAGEAPFTATFDASDSVDPDGTLDKYEWDFDGDGVVDKEGMIVSHTFATNGTYDVTLTVYTKADETATVQKEIVVGEGTGPDGKITIVNSTDKLTTDFDYIFRADEVSSPNGKIVKYSWDFGDGTPAATTKTVTHRFNSKGEYILVLTLTDEEGIENDIEETITIGDSQGAPKAAISTTPDSSSGSLEGKVPFTVNFSASDSTDSDDNITEYNWDLDGDGTAENFGKNVEYTYDEAGTYTATLEVVDADNNSSEATVMINVQEQGIKAVIDANETDGNVPLTVTFDASGSTYQNGEIASFNWDFGDGTKPKFGESKITHRFSKVGSFTVVVTAVGSDNNKATAETIITVREVPLKACIDATFEDGPAPLKTTFDPGCSTGAVSEYFWDFGDGTTSTEVKPTHTFGAIGEYTVSLEVSDNENTVSQSSILITVTED